MTTHQFSISVYKVSVFVPFFLIFVWYLEQVQGSPKDGLKAWQRPGAGSSRPGESLYLHSTFPRDFLWGVGTSAYQTEGSWDSGGKGPSIWDHFTHKSNQDSGSADATSNSYIHWEDDISAVKYLGTNLYAFSLSWSRIFPSGVGDPNPEGVAHYLRLIARLRAEGVEPVVTLYHWDLPLALQEQHGGWRNKSTVEAFVDYSTFCFRTFGGSVKYWLTLHNPYLIAVQGYGTGAHAPGERDGQETVLAVGHNLIWAHAKVWHVYNTQFRPHQRGQISLTLGSHWIEPIYGQSTPANHELCQKSMEAVIGWFASPIHGTGDYPASLKDLNLGLLPEFSPEESAFIRGTADFFALSFGPDTLRMGQRLPLFGQVLYMDLRRVLAWIQFEYDCPDVLVTESGWFTNAAITEEDTQAIYVMRRLLNQVLEAVLYDGTKVFGYIAWSLVDGFEWNFGYGIRRGLFYVDFNVSDRRRIPKTSAKFYRRVIRNGGLSNNQSSEKIDAAFPCDFQWGVSDPVLHVHLHPYSAQFIDPNLYRWNVSGDNSLKAVSGVTLSTRGVQCTDFLSLRRHLRLLEATGVTNYRFALDWFHLLPDGDLSNVNKQALDYYRCFLTELHKLSIKAVVTLYHPSRRSPSLGMPSPLHAAGGWLNQSTGEAFEAYSAFCFEQFAPWVHTWITVNEPNRLADMYNGSTAEQMRAGQHLLLAHARVWQLYDQQYRARHGAQVSFTLHADWVEPANPFLDSHQTAAENFLKFELGQFLDPFLGNTNRRGGGGRGGQVSQDQLLGPAGKHGSLFGDEVNGSTPGLHFTEEEQLLLRGAIDFIAVNHFTTRLVSPIRSPFPLSKSRTSYHHVPIHGCSFLNDPNWHISRLGQAVVPWGLRNILKWVKGRYGNKCPVVVMAAGVDDPASQQDELRQHYIREYLQEASKAHQLDGVDLRGFYIWNLQDRTTYHFGLFAPAHLGSQPKDSAMVYRDLITRHGPSSRHARGAQGSSCGQLTSGHSCTLCIEIGENKPLVFFGVCLCISALILLTVFVEVLWRRGRGHLVRPVGPQKLSRSHWERLGLQRVVRRM